ncbi:helix-turn-helix transcriptional regulator [Aliarcobacter butzleri]|uniref:helix-turn-helix transcriptional regulator n=1 Tax=Aliarcobacter butzleri TaxID=28197 RepID=UPI00125FBD0E|nr:AlpA family phage regulatory protein [Aliarcobacter butzleri]MCT7644444.1 AlpA family phage regulatory protein [Aliarcobacter butzleri]
MNNNELNDKFLKIDDVLIIIPISKASLYRLAKKTKLLKPIKIGGSSFWSQNNINIYFENLKKQNLEL